MAASCCLPAKSAPAKRRSAAACSSIPENIDVAFILNPLMSVEELLQTVCEEYGIRRAPRTAEIKAYVDAHLRLAAR